MLTPHRLQFEALSQSLLARLSACPTSMASKHATAPLLMAVHGAIDKRSDDPGGSTGKILVHEDTLNHASKTPAQILQHCGSVVTSSRRDHRDSRERQNHPPTHNLTAAHTAPPPRWGKPANSRACTQARILTLNRKQCGFLGYRIPRSLTNQGIDGRMSAH